MIIRDAAGPVLMKRYAWMVRLKFVRVKSNCQFGVPVENKGMDKHQNVSARSDRVNQPE